MERLSVEFHPPQSGWIKMVLTYKGIEIPIYTSNVFDPYPAFLTWMDKVFRNDLPAQWHINEEDTFIDFVAEVDDTGKSRLKLVGEQRGEEYEDETVYTFIDDPDLMEITRTIYRSFRDMLDNQFDPKEWGMDLRLLGWRRLDQYLAHD